jgi:hypothetical protein
VTPSCRPIGAAFGAFVAETGGGRSTDSCVTVCACEAPHNVNDHGSTTPEALLLALAGTATTPGNNNIYLGGEPLIVLGPEHAQTLAAAGWSKGDVKRAIWERARQPLSRFSAETSTASPPSTPPASPTAPARTKCISA